MTLKLDKLDFKIISELDLDARKPVSEVARTLKVSKEVVNYRLKKLIDSKIIDGFYPIVDMNRLGYANYRIFLKFKTYTDEILKDLYDFASKEQKISWLVFMGENWDVAIVFVCRNVLDLNEALDKFLFKFAKNINKKEFSTCANIYHFNRRHFCIGDNKPLKEAAFVEQKEKDYVLDKTDRDVIALLQEDSRMSLIQIAERLKMTANGVKYRLDKLIKDRIILAFNIKLNNELLGLNQYKFYLQLDNLTKEAYSQIFNYIKYLEYTIYITKPIGGADIEFEVLVKNSEEVYEITKEIRNKFSELIKDIYYHQLYKEAIINYVGKNT
jgi:DNA-binding Lrp family transcriptional regulator